MELASVMAWRNEPVPLSLVFVTVKTKGTTGLRCSGGSFATVASASFPVAIRLARLDRAILNALAKVEASNTVAIDMNARISAIRRAKACGEVFFFIVLWGEIWGGRQVLPNSSTEKQAKSFAKKRYRELSMEHA
jgi:hypothetical protein